MFKHIIKPIALFRISSEEFLYKREPNHKNVTDDTADSLMVLMLMLEMLGFYFIGYFLGPFHISFTIALLQMGAVVYIDTKIAIWILQSSCYTHKMDELYSYYASLPFEQRKYFYSWKYRLIKLLPILMIPVATLIIGLLLIPIIFPK